MDLQARYDSIVVGSGHNGLVAAAYLAKAGQSVLVLEQNDYLGGATVSAKIFPEYDAWLSRYSYLVSLLPQSIVDELGLNFQTRRRSTASFTAYQDDRGISRGLVLSNVDPARSRQSMFELTGNDSDWGRYQDFLALQSQLAELAWPSLLKPLCHRSEFMKSLKTNAQREAWNAFVECPLGEVIERYIQHDVLRGLVLTDGKIGVFTHAHDPSLIQNRCFLYHVIGGGNGEWRVPVGGMRSLVDALVRCCTCHGVHFLTNARATKVDTAAQCTTVAWTCEDEQFQAEAQNVLINAGPRTFHRLLGVPHSTDSADEGSVIKINMLLKQLPKVKAVGVSSEEAFSGSFHIDEGYAQMQASYECASKAQIPNPPPGEIYCHTLTDSSILSPQLASAGFHTLTLFGLDMPYRLFETDHDATKQCVTQLYLEGLNRICDQPLMECLARRGDGTPCIDIHTPQDLEREVDLDQGNIFHNQPSWFFTDQADLAGNWGCETQYPNVYMAGSSALRGGAVSGIPGHNAAKCILSGRAS